MSDFMSDLLTPKTFVSYQCPVCQLRLQHIEISMNQPLSLGRQCPRCLSVWEQDWDDILRVAVSDFWRREQEAT